MKTPTRGYMVARAGGGIVLDAPTVESTKQGIKQFMAENKQKFQDDPTLYFGGWKDPDTGKLYLELSDNVASKKIALDLGSRRDQISVYDVIKVNTLQTGGTGGTRAEAGTDQHPDNLYGAGTAIRKSAFGLVRLVGTGTGPCSGSVGEGTAGLDADLVKYRDNQARDYRGRFAAEGVSGATANDLFARAKALEPKTTAYFKEVAAANGAEMQGLKHAVKTQQSLARKISSDIHDDPSLNNDYELAASKINDSLRYTMTLP